MKNEAMATELASLETVVVPELREQIARLHREALAFAAVAVEVIADAFCDQNGHLGGDEARDLAQVTVDEILRQARKQHVTAARS